MSKIICDVCGTSFPDSSNQCPICGCAATADDRMIAPQENKEDAAGHGTYTYVKGGRFSKANVKKRNNGKHTAKAEKTEKFEKPEKTAKKKKSNVGLIIAAIALFLAIVAVALYVTFTFFINPAAPAVEEDPTTIPTTQAPTTEPTVLVIPCEDLTCPITLELTEQGQEVKLDVTVLPADTTDIVSYVSGDEAIVTVDADGVVTAVAPGETNIEVTCGEKKAICQVSCNFDGENNPEDEDKEEDKKDDTETTGEGSNHLLEDGTYTLNTYKSLADITLYYPSTHELHMYDEDGNDVEITITSRGTNVCVVEGNLIKPVGKGYCTLVVRFGEGENDFIICIVRVV